MSAVTLIARREIVTRLQQKSYRIGLLVAVAIAIVAVLLPSFFSSDSGPKRYDVGIVGAPPYVAEALQSSMQAQGARATIHRSSVELARQKVKDGDWDAAVTSSGIIADKKDDAVVAIVQNAAALAGSIRRLVDDGLTPQQAVAALSAKPLPVQATSSAQNSQRQTIAIVTVVVLFSQLITFCTWVAMGVVEEKSSRVVELLLTAVRPLQLLAGKLLGIGALAAAQVAVLGGAALVTATVAQTITLPAAEILTVLISFVAFLLGFAFFAALAAALASTVSRQEEVSGILAPVTVSLTLCYVAAFAVAGNGDSLFFRVLAVVPPVSSIAMPARIARDEAAVWEIALAIALLVVAAAAILGLAAKIYRASILHTGSRLKLRDAWRGEAVATAR